jgi:integrase
VTRYFASVDYQRLDPRTQRVQRAILEKTLLEPGLPGKTFADCPIASMTGRLIKVLRDRVAADKPEAANNRVKAIRRLFNWAFECDLVAKNPARDVRYRKNPSQGFHTWTDEEAEQYEARHPIGTKAHLALALLMYTGVRRSDVVLLGRQHARNGRIKFTNYKGRNRKPITVYMPISSELQQVIDSSPTGDLTFLVTAHGKPFSAAGFGNWFKDRCNEAGLSRCSAHGLRKASASRAAENLGTTKELQAIFAWVTTKEPERYTEAANRKKLSERAPLLLRRGKSGT